jgi:GGDEF domain-containing protein
MRGASQPEGGDGVMRPNETGAGSAVPGPAGAGADGTAAGGAGGTAAGGADPSYLVRRIRQLEAELRRRTQELGMLRLQLEVFSTVDPVTGLLNRNGIDDALGMALERLRRLREPFAAIGLDLPGLRPLAEADPGAGEENARHVAALLRGSLRAIDRVGRLDDVTFAVICPLIGRAEYRPPLARLQSLMTAVPFGIEGGADLQARFGVVVVEPGRRPEAAEVLDAVRGALGRATAREPVVVEP